MTMEKAEIKKCLVDFTLTNGYLIQMNMTNARINNHLSNQVGLIEKAIKANMNPSLLGILLKDGWEQIDHADLRQLKEYLGGFYITGIKDKELNTFIKNLINATSEILDGYKRGSSMMVCSNPEGWN